MRRAALALVLGLSACTQDRMEVVDQASRADDYGRADLLAAIAAQAARPTDAAGYRAFAVRVAELRSRFNQGVADLAELELAFLAYGVMAAQLDAPPPAQLAALALTVWPTALRIEPKPGESTVAYLERVCTTELASDCKYVVPEEWPIVLSAMVWRRMKVRARDAYGDCRLCELEPSYIKVLEDYDRHDTAWQARVALLQDRIEPGYWPRAGGNAAPHSGAPLLMLGAETVHLEGAPLQEDEWRRLLAERRAGRTVLGVQLRPRQEVRVLDAALLDAARAGWTELALEVRDGAYPWTLREYRIATQRRGRGLGMRAVDSIQLLVRALDAAAGRLAARDGAPPLIHL